jgi:hypothetical protein
MLLEQAFQFGGRHGAPEHLADDIEHRIVPKPQQKLAFSIRLGDSVVYRCRNSTEEARDPPL